MAVKTTTHKSKLLTDMSIKLSFMGRYIAEQVMPKKRVKLMTDYIMQYDKSHLIRENTRVGPKSITPVYEFGFDSDLTYRTEGYGLKALVTRHDLTQNDKPIDAEKDVMENITELLAVDREVRVATDMLSTSTFTSTTLSSTDQWSDYAGSDPFGDITTAATTIRDASGQLPNTMICDWEVAFKLVQHTDVKDTRLVGPGPLRREKVLAVLADWFGLNVIIGSAMYNTAKEGATASLSTTWGNDVFIGYINPKPGLKTQTCCMTFELDPGRGVYRYDPGDPPNAHYIMVREEGLDEKIIDSDCGYVIENAIA